MNRTTDIYTPPFPEQEFQNFRSSTQQERERFESNVREQRDLAEQVARQAAEDAQSRYNELMQAQQTGATGPEIRNIQQNLFDAQRQAATTSTIQPSYVPPATPQRFRQPVQYGNMPYGTTPGGLSSSANNIYSTPSTYRSPTGVTQPTTVYSPQNTAYSNTNNNNVLPQTFNRGGIVNNPYSQTQSNVMNPVGYQNAPNMKYNTFKGFKPSGLRKIAQSVGYTGPMESFNDFLSNNPNAQKKVDRYTQTAVKMANGGVVKRFSNGGFASDAYLASNPDVAAAVARGEFTSAQHHFDLYGRAEGRSPTGSQQPTPEPTPTQLTQTQPATTQPATTQLTPTQLTQTQPATTQPDPTLISNVNEQEYLAENPDVAAAVARGEFKSGAEHYARFGATEGRTPNARVTTSGTINPESYLEANPDVAAAVARGEFVNAKQHYELYGRAEGRAPQGIDEQAYLAANPDVAAAVASGEFESGLQHYQLYGISEGRSSLGFDEQYYLEANPDVAEAIARGEFANAAEHYARFGATEGRAPNSNMATVGATTVGATTDTGGGNIGQQPTPKFTGYGGLDIESITASRFQNPALPEGAVTVAKGIDAQDNQFIDPNTGQLTGNIAIPTAMAGTSYAQGPLDMQANLAQSQMAAQQIDETLRRQTSAQGVISPDSLVQAQQQTESSVSRLNAAQGTANIINSPVQRRLQDGELITGAAADANVAASFTEQIQAAQASPSDKATVQGQLNSLMQDFDGKNPPAWAAGALRNATAQMAARGLGASSLAGQAIVQAAMESALPIAQADASTQAQFEAQNLSNRQQRAILAAQQRAAFIGQEFDQEFQARVTNAAKISDIANINFTAEQQVQLENSRAINTMNLNNLSNRQALVMSEAAALANLDSQNLNNRQQAAVQNAQNFLQMDMTNLSNEQQMRMFSAQSRIQSLFTDQAAENATRQFNATSQNQVDQFFSTLANNVSQFNATQSNAQAQFNAGQQNVIERFNAEINNQRDQFNATNLIQIAQNNAVWRRTIATADTAAINRVNEINARNVLDISNTAYDNLWNFNSDLFEYAWRSAENEADRANALSLAKINADSTVSAQKASASAQKGSALGSLAVTAGKAVLENFDTIAGWF